MSSATPTTATTSNEERIARARQIVRDEMNGMEQLAGFFDDSIARAVDLIASRTGRLVVTGIGKSGLIGAKLAATFASTGTSSFFLHAAEASHGDLGMIVPGDVVLALSNSGNSRELYPIIDFCSTNNVPLIGVCSQATSRLARASAVPLLFPEAREVCPNNLAPTTSATLTLVMGHVLAVLLMETRSFRDDEFAAFHPGGRLGLMLQSVERYIENHHGEVPAVAPEAKLETVISTLADGRQGCVVVLEGGNGDLLGIITEGDLRRAYGTDMFDKSAADIMTREPATVTMEDLMRDVMEIMKERRIANVIAMDGKQVAALLHIKDLMQQGYL